jgi:hypothetical protein
MSSYALLTEAITNRGEVLLSTSIDRPGQFVARLEGEVDVPDHAFRALITEGNPQLLDPLIAGGRPLEVSFNTAAARVFFDCVPLKRERKWFKQRILLKWPEQMTVVERRGGSREAVPSDLPLVAILSGPSGGANLRARVFDISPTGAALLCPIHPDLPEPLLGETYAVLVTYQDIEFRFNALCRHVQHLSSNSLKAGIEFEARKDLDPPSLARFQRMLEDMEALRIRRTFRSALTKTALFATN